MLELGEAQKQVLWFMLEGGYECLFINQEEIGTYRLCGARPYLVDAQPTRSALIGLERIGLVTCSDPIARREWFSLTDKGREVAKELGERYAPTNQS